jgi:hypothetical protein
MRIRTSHALTSLGTCVFVVVAVAYVVYGPAWVLSVAPIKGIAVIPAVPAVTTIPDVVPDLVHDVVTTIEHGAQDELDRLLVARKNNTSTHGKTSVRAARTSAMWGVGAMLVVATILVR